MIQFIPIHIPLWNFTSLYRSCRRLSLSKQRVPGKNITGRFSQKCWDSFNVSPPPRHCPLIKGSCHGARGKRKLISFLTLSKPLVLHWIPMSCHNSISTLWPIHHHCESSRERKVLNPRYDLVLNNQPRLNFPSRKLNTIQNIGKFPPKVVGTE